MVKSYRGFSHEQRLEKLNLFSLVRRRLRGDLIFAYYLSHGSLDLPFEEILTWPPCSNFRGRLAIPFLPARRLDLLPPDHRTQQLNAAFDNV